MRLLNAALRLRLTIPFSPSISLCDAPTSRQKKHGGSEVRLTPLEKNLTWNQRWDHSMLQTWKRFALKSIKWNLGVSPWMKFRQKKHMVDQSLWFNMIIFSQPQICESCIDIGGNHLCPFGWRKRERERCILSIYIYTTHVCIYVSMYLCIYVSMYLCMDVCLSVCLYVCLYVIYCYKTSQTWNDLAWNQDVNECHVPRPESSTTTLKIQWQNMARSCTMGLTDRYPMIPLNPLVHAHFPYWKDLKWLPLAGIGSPTFHILQPSVSAEAPVFPELRVALRTEVVLRRLVGQKEKCLPEFKNPRVSI